MSVQGVFQRLRDTRCPQGLSAGHDLGLPLLSIMPDVKEMYKMYHSGSLLTDSWEIANPLTHTHK